MKKSYKNAGVDKEAGYKTVESIKSATRLTHNANVLNQLGDFAALYALTGYKSPILVSGADGVGTKIMLAKQYDLWDDVGADCFAMCANDVLCHGAKPLFFLDYIACGKLNPETAARIVKSIAKACKENNTALVGGETAEMPGMYQIGDYDIAGFCVGAVEKEKIVNGKTSIAVGDKAIGIASNGFHSNGFSLIRHLTSDFEQTLEGSPLYKSLLAPTKTYVTLVLDILEKFPFQVKGMAHITGGGIIENLPRILPDNCSVSIDTKNVPIQAVFEWIKEFDIDAYELWNTFNMGVGFCLVVSPSHADKIVDYIEKQNERAFIMGEIKSGGKRPIELIF